MAIMPEKMHSATIAAAKTLRSARRAPRGRDAKRPRAGMVSSRLWNAASDSSAVGMAPMGALRSRASRYARRSAPS